LNGLQTGVDGFSDETGQRHLPPSHLPKGIPCFLHPAVQALASQSVGSSIEISTSTWVAFAPAMAIKRNNTNNIFGVI
jgi:hypothetical protein